MKKLIVFIIVIISNYSLSQSVTGTSGLIHIPSARMLEDGQLVLGAAFIPKGIYHRTFGADKFNIRLNPGLNTYITYGILPFMEVMFRYSHELNLPVNSETLYFPDRMFSLRFRIFDENSILPSIVLGIHDVAQYVGVVSGTPSFSTNYLVLSKFQKINKVFNVDFTLGYAFDISKYKSIAYKGLFGGFKINHIDMDRISLSIEYDSEKLIIGSKINLFKNLQFMIGIWDLNKPTFSINYTL